MSESVGRAEQAHTDSGRHSGVVVFGRMQIRGQRELCDGRTSPFVHAEDTGGRGHRLLRKESGERTAGTDGVIGDSGSVARPNSVRECIPIEGNGSRASHRGPGYGEAGDPSFTLNSVEKHSVAIDVYNQDVAGDIAPSLTAASVFPNTSGPKVMEIYAVDMGAGKSASGIHKNISPTLSTTHYGEPVINDER